MSTHEHGFDPGQWMFEDSQNGTAICCRHILEGLPILRVTHDEDDGCWQVLCGGQHILEDAKVVCLGCMVSRDETLMQLANLPLGWCADRHDAHSPWERSANESEEEEEENDDA